MNSFAPIVGEEPKVLILGSMPSQKSLQNQQYYGHPQNAFWWIMAHILNFPVELEYHSKVKAVASAGVAVWDALYACQRQGSLDSSIVRESEQPNDIDGFLKVNPTISLLAFNGAAAKAIAVRHHIHALNDIDFVQLPSTSPAHASVTKSDKCKIWRHALSPHLVLK